MDFIKRISNLIEESKFDEVQEILPTIHDKSVSLLVKSMIEDKLGNFDKRKDLCEEIIEMDDKLPVAEVYAYFGLLWVHFRKGNYDKASEYLIELENAFAKYKDELTEYVTLESSILNSRGSIALETGNNELAEESFRESLKLLMNSGEDRRIASLKNNLAFVLQKQGNLDEALSLYNEALEFYNTLGMESAICRIKSNIAEVFRFRTEFDIALKYHKEVLEIRERLDNSYDLALSNFYVGRVLYDIRSYESALLYLTQSRQLWDSVGNNQWLSLTLLVLGKSLIELGLDTKDVEAKFDKLAETSDNVLIHQRYDLFRALTLKSSNRMAKVAEAQILLEKLVNSSLIDFELTYDAIMNHSELLLIELSMTQDNKIYDEIKDDIETLEQLARINHAYGKIVEVLLLKAKMAIIELDYDDAEKIITQAEIISKEKNLTYYSKLVDKHRELLHEDMLKLKAIIDDNKNLLERAEIVDLKDYLKKANKLKFEIDGLDE